MPHFSTVVVLLTLAVSTGPDPTSRSEPVAKELVKLLQQYKLESVAARESEHADRFVAALYIPGQLLVVNARYSAPAYLREHLTKREYKDAYVALSSAGDPENKYFVQDLGADGLRPTRVSDAPFDTIYESVTNRTAFDGDWRKQKLSELRYYERYSSADERYAQLLAVLVAEVKRGQTGR